MTDPTQLHPSMKVAFDGRDLSQPALRGMPRYIIGLVRELVRRGVAVTLFHREREPLNPAHVADLGCAVRGLPDYGGMYWEQVSVPLALLGGRFDLYHVPAERGVPFLAPCPVVLTYHSVTFHSYRHLIRTGLLPGRVEDYLGVEPERGWRNRYFAQQAPRANHILTPSAFCRREIIELLGMSPARVSVTPLAVADEFHAARRSDADRLRTLQRLGVRAPYLLYVGGYERHKNPAGLLEVFSRVRRARPDLSLVLVGTGGVPPWLLEKTNSLGLKVGRELTFLVDLKEDLLDLYDGAELFVTLSWRETFCLPALEAMTRAVPVVSTSWGAAPEVVGEAGKLVDPTDHAPAVAAILALLDPTAHREFSEKATRAAGKFSWSETAAQTLRIYRNLCGCRSKMRSPKKDHL